MFIKLFVLCDCSALEITFTDYHQLTFISDQLSRRKMLTSLQFLLSQKFYGENTFSNKYIPLFLWVSSITL